MGSYGGIDTPFGERPPIEIGSGGNFNADQWFRGPAAPFGGLEWTIDDHWTVKAEYSSDAYLTEAKERGTFERRSPINVGLEYQRGDALRLGAYYLYGTAIGFAAHISLDPKKGAANGGGDKAPEPIRPRPSRAQDPEAWSGSWVLQADAAAILRRNLAKSLEADGIMVSALHVSEGATDVHIVNQHLSSEAQAVGRTARAMARVMPASVERFTINLVAEGMPVSRVSLLRSDLEAQEFALDGAAQMHARSQIGPAHAPLPSAVLDDATHSKFVWSIGPTARLRLFDRNEPFKLGLGMRANARYELAPGLFVQGSVTKLAFSNLDDRPPIPERRRLHPVRSANYFYDKLGDPALETLYFSAYRKLGSEIYGRLALGYLERMYGGVSTELLWMPTDRRCTRGCCLVVGQPLRLHARSERGPFFGAFSFCALRFLRPSPI